MGYFSQYELFRFTDAVPKIDSSKVVFNSRTPNSLDDLPQIKAFFLASDSRASDENYMSEFLALEIKDLLNPQETAYNQSSMGAFT